MSFTFMLHEGIARRLDDEAPIWVEEEFKNLWIESCSRVVSRFTFYGIALNQRIN